MSLIRLKLSARSWTVFVFWLLYAGAAIGVDVSFQLQHSLRGQYSEAGEISGRLPLDNGKTDVTSAKLSLRWSTMTRDDIEALLKLAAQDELYTLRIEPQQQPATPKGAAVTFSIPASCFAQAISRPHRVDLHVTPEGWLVGIDFRHQTTLACRGGASPPSVGEVRWPKATDVKVIFPIAGPTVQWSPASADERAHAQYLDESYKQAMQGEPGSKGQPGEPAKEKKEKSFLEKNWLLLACGGMLVMNMLNKPDPAGAPPGARRAAPAPAR